MPRPSTITYDDVARVAAAQLASGTKPTNQTLQTALGGSFATIAPFLKRWKQEHQVAPQPNTTLPDSVATAIQQEIVRQVQEATTALNAELTDASATIDGLTKENQDAAAELVNINKQLADAKNTIAESTGTITELRKQLDDERAKTTQALDNLQATKIDLARTEGYKEIISALQSEVATLREHKPLKK